MALCLSNDCAFSGGTQAVPAATRSWTAFTRTFIDAAESQDLSYPERVVEPLMIDGRALSSEADEIISKLMDLLSVHVALVDVDEKRSHSRMTSWWFSHELRTEDIEAAVLNRAQNDTCLIVRINRRWIMRVAGRGATVDDGWIVTCARPVPLSMEQVAFVERAAERLTRFLPTTSKSSELPWPDGSSGGNSGGAELGIPVWWARKARN